MLAALSEQKVLQSLRLRDTLTAGGTLRGCCDDTTIPLVSFKNKDSRLLVWESKGWWCFKMNFKKFFSSWTEQMLRSQPRTEQRRSYLWTVCFFEFVVNFIMINDPSPFVHPSTVYLPFFTMYFPFVIVFEKKDKKVWRLKIRVLPHLPHRASALDVMIPTTQTSTASGLTSQMWNLETTSWRFVWGKQLRPPRAFSLCCLPTRLLLPTFLSLSAFESKDPPPSRRVSPWFVDCWLPRPGFCSSVGIWSRFLSEKVQDFSLFLPAPYRSVSIPSIRSQRVTTATTLCAVKCSTPATTPTCPAVTCPREYFSSSREPNFLSHCFNGLFCARSCSYQVLRTISDLHKNNSEEDGTLKRQKKISCWNIFIILLFVI